jgi:protoheme IX farnesyltransferase
MIFVSILPAFGLTGSLILSNVAAIIVLILGIFVLRLAILHHKSPSNSAARSLMLGTIAYLPLLQITYVVDHYLN